MECEYAEAVANSPGLVKPVSKRKWSTKEDFVLISGWLNTSKDHIVSNEQKVTSFWKRIEAYVNCSPLLTGCVPREWSQCKQRWGRVNEQVCKFVGSYEAAMKHQSSGQNEDDVMKAAHEIFFNDYQAKFTMEHCWRELRHDQKWKSVFKSRDGAKEKRKEAEEVIPEDEVRPPGVKASKAAKRKRHGHEAAFDQIESCYVTGCYVCCWITGCYVWITGPKAELFAERQESTRKDVERAFRVLQSRFAIVKNTALLWDKEKIGKIMRTCVILHNMIVEDEQHRYIQIDTSEFESEESSRSSKVKSRESVNVPMLTIRNQIRDPHIHERLKADLVENVWEKYGNHDE
uniref:Myb-like domain-containing protein n=1 Tax=Brassica oleracea var. oleracea TaxID=109376 RepID=A0A0D3CAL5_BRAOL